MTSKAIVFTHLQKLRWMSLIDEPIEQIYAPLFEAYSRCRNVAVVYLYIDTAIHSTIKRYTDQDLIVPNNVLKEIDRDLLLKERRIKGVLGGLADRHSQGPAFVVVGLDELLAVLHNLETVDPTLVTFLWGENGTFTYDTPKFVESILILARGQTPHLAAHPVVRFDEDVIPNDGSVQKLLEAFSDASERQGYYFFSGCYGTPGGTKSYDPVNDHAVRMNWLAPNGTLAGDRFSKRAGERTIEGPEITRRLGQCRTFLADISQLGAPQEWPLNENFHIADGPIALTSAEGAKLASPTLQEIMGHHLLSTPRKTQQVISGAGLIMSRRAAALLPPFCSFSTLTTWVDDYVKRLLHEALGDIQPSHKMNIPAARFRQDRHPAREGGTSQPKPEKIQEYLGRLIRGCMLCRVVAAPPHMENQTSFAKAIKAKALSIPGDVEPTLNEQMMADAMERGDQVLRTWRSDKYLDTAQAALIDRIKDPKGYLAEQARTVVADCMRYVAFVERWPAFIRAVDRIPFTGEEWFRVLART